MSRLLTLSGLFRLRSGVSVNQADIVHLKQYYNPRFRFEWHQKQRRVYCIDLDMAQKAGGQSLGNLIGTDIETQGAAHGNMLTWLRGFRAGKEAIAHNDQGKLILFGGK